MAIAFSVVVADSEMGPVYRWDLGVGRPVSGEVDDGILCVVRNRHRWNGALEGARLWRELRRKCDAIIYARIRLRRLLRSLYRVLRLLLRRLNLPRILREYPGRENKHEHRASKRQISHLATSP